MTKHQKGMLCCICAGASWGFAGVCGQFLFDQRFWNVDFIIPIRILSAGLILLLVALKLEGRDGFRRLFGQRRNVRDMVIFGILGIGLCQYAYYTTISAANATTATVLCYLGPVMIILWQALRFRRPPSGRETLAVAVAVAGTFLLATHGDPTSLAISVRALFWGLVSAFSQALYSVQPQRLTSACGTLTATSCGMILAGVLLCLLRQPWAHAEGVFDLPAWLAFAMVVLLGSVLCFAMYFTGVLLIGPEKAGILSATEPMVSALLSVFWLHVPFRPMDYVGFVLVVSTIFILGIAPRKKEASADSAALTEEPPAETELLN